VANSQRVTASTGVRIGKMERKVYSVLKVAALSKISTFSHSSFALLFFNYTALDRALSTVRDSALRL
jgi:hypothetical protein